MANFFDQFDTAQSAAPSAPQSPYAERIGGIESAGSGGYQAVGPETGRGRALGKYQIMPSNIGPWSREILGREVTPQEFMANPQLQDQIFNGKFGQYVDKYGPEGASKAWFAGEKGMHNPNARDVLGTTVAGYADKFNRASGVEASSQSRSVAAPSASPAGPNFFDQFDTAPAPSAVPEGPPQAQVGMGEAIARGVQSGATFNFGDELRGVLAAGGGKIGSDTEPAGPHNAIIGAYKLLISGDPEARRIYDETVAAERERNKAAEAQNPASYIGGQVGGAVAIPVGGMLGAATLPLRMARGAAVGAGMGGAAGLGEGEGAADRLGRAAMGAGLGGIVGGVAPPLVEGALQAGRAAINPVVNAVRGAANPEAEASRRVTTAITRDMAADPAAATRLAPQEFAGASQNGGPARLMDMGGETTRALARSAANTSTEGRQVLNQTISDRFEGQNERITDWFKSAFNYPNADAQQQAIKATARAVNDRNYSAVMARHPVVSVPDEITQRPVVAQAMKDAISLAKNRGEKLENVPQTRSILSGDGYHIADDVTEPAKTSLRYWDYVKKAMDSRIEGMKRRGGIDDLDSKQKADYGGLKDARDALVAHLDSVAKGYKEARRGAAGFFDAEDALEAGQKFVTQNFATNEAKRALGKMSPDERKLFQDGFVSRYIEVLDKTGERRNILNQIGQSKAAREKLELVLGPKKSAELEASLRIEKIVDLARGSVQGNSTTARQWAEMGFAGGAAGLGGYGAITQDPQSMTIAAVTGALVAGRRGIDTRVARKVAELLVSDDPVKLSRGVQLVARNTAFMDGLRKSDLKIAQGVGAWSPKGTLPVQSVNPGRADENGEPQVQRPRGQ